MAEGKKDTIEKQTERVLELARELASAINNFLTPAPTSKGEQSTPILGVLGRIEDNLTQTMFALKDAITGFGEIQSRIR